MSRPLLALLALGLATACGGPNNPGVSVTNAQSDVIFAGASKSPTAAVPGTAEGAIAAGGPAAAGDSPALAVFDPPTLNTFDNDDPGFQFPQPGGSSAPQRSNICPGPPVFASAPTAATTSVQGKPKPGFYLWQSLVTTDLGSNVKSTTAKYTNYEVKNVSETTTRPNPNGDPTSVFSYDLVAPVGKGNTITFTIQVKQNAQGANVGTGNVGNPRRVAEPDAGIAIKEQVEKNAQGEEVARFTPSVPVLILPLPVVGGAEFTGTGSDPRTGGQMTVSGQVKGVDRVTGCSEFVQGIRVDATVASRDVPGQAADSVAEVFTFETQAGGLPVGVAQTPTNGKVTGSSVFGERATAKPRDIPKEQRL